MKTIRINSETKANFDIIQIQVSAEKGYLVNQDYTLAQLIACWQGKRSGEVQKK